MGYDLKITGKKALTQLVYVIIAGAGVVYAENPIYLALVPIFTAFENYIKHKDD